MQWNKKSAYMLAALSLLLGSAGAIGLQVHAQQSSNPPTPPAQIQTQSAAVGEQNNSATDNETKEGIETNENLPGDGHQDQAGANVDHQFEGIE